MFLITTYYKSINIARNKEIDKCLLKNIENKYIKKIYLLNNEIYDLHDLCKSNKIIQVKISNDDNYNYRLKYCDAVKFINDNLKGNICILANSDIYFDETLFKINRKIIHNNFFALLRYDEDNDGNKKIFTRHGQPRDDSQDCWIFQSPLNVNLKKIDFSFGTPGCDSIFATCVYEEGKLRISNPCYDIISIHVHNTEFRTYNEDNRIHGKYCLLPPCKIGNARDVLFVLF